jgi:hypothetical protein
MQTMWRPCGDSLLTPPKKGSHDIFRCPPTAEDVQGAAVFVTDGVAVIKVARCDVQLFVDGATVAMSASATALPGSVAGLGRAV